MLVLAFESADHPLEAWMARALELVSSHGGRYDAEAVARSMRPRIPRTPHRRGRRVARRLHAHAVLARSRGRARRDHGHVRDRDHVGPFRDVLQVRQGRRQPRDHARDRPEGTVSCRFTHLYPDGPRPTSRSPPARQMATSPARSRPGATSSSRPMRPSSRTAGPSRTTTPSVAITAAVTSAKWIRFSGGCCRPPSR